MNVIFLILLTGKIIMVICMTSSDIHCTTRVLILRDTALWDFKTMS